MLNTNTNPVVQGTSTVSVTNSQTNTATQVAVINMTANLNSQNGTISIVLSPGDFATLQTVANNASTQADVQAFFAQVLTTAADAGMTYYGAPSSK